MDHRFDSEWIKRSTVRHGTRPEMEPMIQSHYLKKWPAVVPCKLVMCIEKEGLVGMVVFAYPPKQTFKRYGGLIWELARLWVDDLVPKNGETWLISKAIRHIRNSHPEVAGLVSYADPSAGHSGLIYRAANWVPDGYTDGERKTPRFDYLVGSKRYSRRAHIPSGAPWVRIARASKARFYYGVQPK